MSKWPVVALRDVADIAAGITLGRKTKQQALVSVPYLRVANVQDGKLNLAEVKRIDATHAEIERLRLRAGDLLLTEGGDLDKLGRGTCWRDELPVCIHQNHIFRVRLPADQYDPDFVAFQVGSGYGKAYFFAHAKKTTGIASINQQVLGSFPLMTPPLDEQREISRCVVAELSAVEQAIAAARLQLCELSQFAPSLLRFEFASIPRTDVRPISELAQTGSGTTPSRSRADFWHPPVYPWVKTGEVAFAPIRQTEEAVSESALRSCSLSLLPPRTVLVAMYGQGKTRGQSAVLEVPATSNQACFAILPSEHLDADYLQFWLRHSYEELRALSQSRGGNQSNLSGAVLNGFPVPVVPLAQQRGLVARVKAALEESEALHANLRRRLAEIQRLPARLLAQAFGEAAA